MYFTVLKQFKDVEIGKYVDIDNKIKYMQYTISIYFIE